MDKRKHSEHVQPGKPKPAADLSAAVTPGRIDKPAEPPAPEAEPAAQDPAMANRYWIAIVLWAAGFVLMLLYELAAAIWRG